MKRNVIVAIVAFSIAMAALESAVVVYLRALYYPDGFTVAFKLIEERIVLVELARELATLIMLFAVGYIAGHNFNTRFAGFLISFGIWDLFYYLWLKVFINWPASLLEWDILFLIPWTWLGPVLAPVLCSITMLFLGWVLIREPDRKFHLIDKTLLWTGIALILFTFLQDYGSIIINNDLLSEYENLMTNQTFISIASAYLPQSYNWTVFALGESAFVMLIVRWYRYSVERPVMTTAF
jgi:hypothetical protein